jgi:hypothetical protein
MQALSYTCTRSAAPVKEDPFGLKLIPFGRLGRLAGSVYYFFIVIIIRHEATAAAHWALLLIVRILFNDAITIAVRTGFHVCLPAPQA